MWIFQALVIVSLIGLYISYRQHHCMYPLIIAIISALLVIYGYHFDDSEHWIYFLYAGITGLFIATLWNYQRNRFHSCCIDDKGDEAIELKSTITCPNCGYKKDELMPENACTYFYECESCKARIKPLTGDCCVYCSYGTVKCPPMQSGTPCCAR